MARRSASLKIKKTLMSPAMTAAPPSPPPLPPLPDARTILVNDGRCIIEYIEEGPTVQPTTNNIATFVLIHGAPGTLKDYRYLMPLLSKRARVITVNVPGFGGSTSVNKCDYNAQIAAPATQLAVSEAVAALCKTDANVFLVGHSFGGHTAISVAALIRAAERPCSLQGMALLASAGHRPHQTLVPRTAYVFTRIILAGIPLISWATAELTRWIMSTFVGFPRAQPLNYYVSGLYRQTTTDYDRVMQDLEELSNLPTFYAWSRNDIHIEEPISLALNDACKGPGPRFAFERGGHNIQKTRAPMLAEELLKWTEDVVCGRPSRSSEIMSRI